ncbi:MAG: helix-turn-helix domain-containing protein [Tannerella sp.]|jgi:AraC-like DNA-binding protein|nr:helix-turn-helix domain-containing protein [Tannerella sp.]
MQKKIRQLSYQQDIKGELGSVIKSIDDELMLFENVPTPSELVRSIKWDISHPVKTDVTMMLTCTGGLSRGKINLKSYETKAPCIIIILPGQILECEYISDDFTYRLIAMSKRFTEILFMNISDKLPVLLSVNANQHITLDDSDLEMFNIYYEALKNIVAMRDNQHRLEIAKHLTLALFYHSDSKLHHIQEKPASPRALLVKQFLTLVENHYREQRQAGFYADKLCLTPKYLSQIIKFNTGKSVNEWIEAYIMLEAKALLNSTDMTVQQIADELHFPSQSFFGKYFKRLEGVSPKQYRQQ